MNLYLALPLYIDEAQKFFNRGHIFFHFLVTPDNTVSNTVNGICEPWDSMFARLWVRISSLRKEKLK